MAAEPASGPTPAAAEPASGPTPAAAEPASLDPEEARRIAAGDPDVANPRSLPAFTYAAPPSRRMTILKGLLVLGFMVFVFGILLPRYVDYGEVLDSLRALTLAQVVVVFAFGSIAWVASGAVQAALLPGLGLRHSTISWLAGQGVANTIPGPVDLAVRFILYRQWGHAAEPSSLSIVLAGVFDQLAALSMPVVAVIVLATEDQSSRTLLLVALVGAVAIAVIFGVGLAMLRSERFALAIGRFTERCVRLVFRLLRRPTPTGIPQRVLSLRLDVKDLLLSRGGLAYAADLSGRVFYGLVFVLCLRASGVPDSVLTAGAILAVYAAVGVALILPIAPGGAGTPQVLYIAWLGSVAGPDWNAQVSAGVFLFFIVQWVAPTILGWITLAIVRRGRPLLSAGTPTPAPAPSVA
jgi:uncharacterized membrane protein YbhN (UPF0104 family)